MHYKSKQVELASSAEFGVKPMSDEDAFVDENQPRVTTEADYESKIASD